MSGFGGLWRIRTRKHSHTTRSIPTSTGPGRFKWPRLRETELLRQEEERLKVRVLHAQRRASIGRLRSAWGGLTPQVS